MIRPLPFAHAACLSLVLLCSCQKARRPDVTVGEIDNLNVANKFIDAFYSFDRDGLASSLAAAKGSQPNILYYQKWAECGNYKIITRHTCITRNDSVVSCPVTVKDDLMAGLNIDFNVTDSFHITIVDRQIRSVETSSNDPDVYYEAKDWVKKNRGELVDGPCEGAWNGGSTPCECIHGMIKGFAEFNARK